MGFSDVSDGEIISTTQLVDEIECYDVADEELIMACHDFAFHSVSFYVFLH